MTFERLRAAMEESLRQIHLSHPREPGCMPGRGPLHVALLDGSEGEIIPHDCGPVETCDCVNPPRR